MSMTSCMIIDWTPVSVSFYVQDKDGHDLLNPEDEAFIGDKISVSYNGMDYDYTPVTKMYPAVFNGFTITKDNASARYIATFGEFDGGSNYNDDYIITLPDGSQKTLHLDRRVNNVTVSVRERWRLDGELVDIPFTIVY